MTSSATLDVSAVPDRKPLMTGQQILLMNVGFFGIQYSFGMQQTADQPDLRVPRTPVAGRAADPEPGRPDHGVADPAADRGDQRPDMEPPLGSAQALLPGRGDRLLVCLFLFPFVAAIWMAVLLLWLLDVIQQHRDGALPGVPGRQASPSQLARGLPHPVLLHRPRASPWPTCRCSCSRKSSSAATAGRDPLLGVRLVLPRRGLLHRVRSSSRSLSTPEGPHRAPKELAHPPGPTGGLTPVRAGDRRCRPCDACLPLHKLGLVYLFQWYAIISTGNSCPWWWRSPCNTTPEDKVARTPMRWP